MAVSLVCPQPLKKNTPTHAPYNTAPPSSASPEQKKNKKQHDPFVQRQRKSGGVRAPLVRNRLVACKLGNWTWLIPLLRNRLVSCKLGKWAWLIHLVGRKMPALRLFATLPPPLVWPLSTASSAPQQRGGATRHSSLQPG